MPPTVAEAITHGRRAISQLEPEILSQLLREYEQVWWQTERTIMQFEAQIQAAIDAGQTVKPSWVRQQTWYRQVQGSIDDQFVRFNHTALSTIVRGQSQAVGISAEATSLFRQAVGIETSLAGRVNAGAFERWVSAVQPNSPIRGVINKYQERTQDAILRHVTDGIGSGQGVGQMVRNITRDIGPDAQVGNLQTLVRTETLRAYRGSSRDGFEAIGPDVIAEWEWMATKSFRTCAACLAMDTRRFKYDQYPGLFHVACFPAGTIVSTVGIEAAYRYWYNGPLVEITTASGHYLRGTPNHPVLTTRGWVSMDRLCETDDVISGTFRQSFGSKNPDVNDIPSEISKVFDALADVSPLQRVPSRRDQFHGDGGENGYVDVVTANGVLSNSREAAIFQPSSQEDFAIANEPSLMLASYGPAVQGVGGFALAATGFMGRGRHSDSFIGAHLCHTGSHGFGPSSGSDISSDQSSPDSIYSNIESSGESEFGFSQKVQTDKIVHVNVSAFSGHVYNLQTESGRYLANAIIPSSSGEQGLIVHNCRCVIRPIPHANLVPGALPQRESGEDWLRRQEEKHQRGILATPSRYDAFQDGAKLDDFLGIRRNATWGDSVAVKPMRDTTYTPRDVPKPPTPKRRASDPDDDRLVNVGKVQL